MAYVIGREIKRRREAAGLSVYQMADVSAIAVSTIYRIEGCEQTDVRLSALEIIAEALGCDVKDFLVEE